MNKTKCIAEFTTWTGEKVVKEIKKEWAQDIADAVRGQYFFIKNPKGFAINGADFCKVDIYEVADES